MKVTLFRGQDHIILALGNRRRVRVFLTENEAQHLSNRLQYFAKGNFGLETVLEYPE